MNFLIEDKRPVSFLGGFPPPPGKGSSTSECFRLARSARCVWSWLDCWEAFRVLSLIFMGTTWKAAKGKTRNPSLRKPMKMQLLNPRNHIRLEVLPAPGSLSARSSDFSESTTCQRNKQMGSGHGYSTQHISEPGTTLQWGGEEKLTRSE